MSRETFKKVGQRPHVHEAAGPTYPHTSWSPGQPPSIHGPVAHVAQPLPKGGPTAYTWSGSWPHRTTPLLCAGPAALLEEAAGPRCLIIAKWWALSLKRASPDKRKTKKNHQSCARPAESNPIKRLLAREIPQTRNSTESSGPQVDDDTEPNQAHTGTSARCAFTARAAGPEPEH